MSTPYTRSIEALREMATLLRQCGAAIEDLEDQRAALADRLNDPPTPPVVTDPPVIVDPPTNEPDPPIVVDPPPVGSVLPDFSAYAFAHLMPQFPAYVRPTEADCDWIVDRPNLRAVSRRGLGEVALDATSKGYIKQLHKRSMEAGHTGRLTFGLIGHGGNAFLGGLYNKSEGRGAEDVCHQRPDGSWAPIDVQFLGLDDTAELRLMWGTSYFGRTARLGVFGMGIDGFPTTHAIGANAKADGCGPLIFDDFAMLRPSDAGSSYPTPQWANPFHIGNYESLVVHKMKRRGRPGEPAPIFREHGLYDKGSSHPGSSTWILESDLRGGNRSCYQMRPGADETYMQRRTSSIVIAGCDMSGHGWDHPSEEGGATISIWACAQAFVLANNLSNARYKSLLVSGQSWGEGGLDRNWYYPSGHPLGKVYVSGNRMSSPGSPRYTLHLAHAEHVIVDDTNVIDGSFAINPAASMVGPLVSRPGRVTLVGDLTRFPRPFTQDSQDLTRDLTMGDAQFQAMCVPTWAEALE